MTLKKDLPVLYKFNRGEAKRVGDVKRNEFASMWVNELNGTVSPSDIYQFVFLHSIASPWAMAINLTKRHRAIKCLTACSVTPLLPPSPKRMNEFVESQARKVGCKFPSPSRPNQERSVNNLSQLCLVQSKSKQDTSWSCGGPEENRLLVGYHVARWRH